MPCTRHAENRPRSHGRPPPPIRLPSDVKSTFHFGIERIYPAQTAPSHPRGHPIRFPGTPPAIVSTRCAELAELADATVSKTVVRKDVWVRVPHSALAPRGSPARGGRSPVGSSSYFLGVQPPGPTRRGCAPRTPHAGGCVRRQASRLGRRCDPGFRSAGISDRSQGEPCSRRALAGGELVVFSGGATPRPHSAELRPRTPMRVVAFGGKRLVLVVGAFRGFGWQGLATTESYLWRWRALIGRQPCNPGLRSRIVDTAGYRVR